MIVKRAAVLVALGVAAFGIALPATASAAPRAAYVNDPPQCQGGADPGWMCAYEHEGFTGHSVGMYDCGNYTIPFYTTGSWDDEQYGHVQPWLYWVDSTRAPWHMPPAISYQRTGVDWRRVLSITNC